MVLAGERARTFRSSCMWARCSSVRVWRPNTPFPWHSCSPGDSSRQQAAWAQLATCYDPEIPIDIVNLGLVYACTAEALPDGRFHIAAAMTLTAPGCGMGTLIADEARDKLLQIPGVAEAEVKLVWDPPWSREMMSEAARLEMGMF